MMDDDSTLLRRYASDRSESHFAEIVRRHIDFVYSAALRQVNGDAHLAQDVAQLVFTDLARKANRVAACPVLAGWLFTSTRFAAAKLVRATRRRQAREQEAILMQINSPSESGIDWDRVRPVLDEALAELEDRDREAILLRYLGGHDFAEVGARLSLSANAARMRVDRAVDKLRLLLARRGATSTAGALALALANQAIASAPAGLAASVTGTALAGAGTATMLTFMSLTKLQLTLAAVALVAGTGFYAVQANRNAALRAELAGLPSASADIARLRSANADLERTIRQAKTFQVTPAELAQLQAAVATKQQAPKPAPKTLPTRREASVHGAAGPEVGEAYPINGLDQRPVLSNAVPPTYPADLAAAGIEGSAVVSFIINKDGHVLGAEAVESTHAGFETAAVAAIEQWEFKAGAKNGRQVNTRVTQRVEFSLGNETGARPTSGVTPPVTNWF
jgi:RNA polymerase sigma factor (sigma-70 family)